MCENWPKLPVIGREFVVAVTGVTPNSTGLLLFGSSNTQWGAIRLPLGLAPIGAPNCSLLVSLDNLVSLGTGSGAVIMQAVLPKDRSLIGGVFYTQFLAPDARANLAGMQFSNAATAVIGTAVPSASRRRS